MGVAAPPLEPLADGGLGEQLYAWFDVSAAWSQDVPCGPLVEDIAVLRHPPAGGARDKTVLRALVNLLLVVEANQRGWSQKLYALGSEGTSAPAEGGAGMRSPGDTVREHLSHLHSSMKQGVQSRSAALADGLVTPGEVHVHSPREDAAVAAPIAQQQLVPSAVDATSPFFVSVVDALQRQIAGCNMPRPVACVEELRVLLNVLALAGEDGQPSSDLATLVGQLADPASSNEEYVRALRGASTLLAWWMSHWTTCLCDRRDHDKAGWRPLQDYLSKQQSLFLDAVSVCEYPARSAVTGCRGLRCVQLLLDANVAVVAGKWVTTPCEYTQELVEMATWTSIMRGWFCRQARKLATAVRAERPTQADALLSVLGVVEQEETSLVGQSALVAKMEAAVEKAKISLREVGALVTNMEAAVQTGTRREARLEPPGKSAAAGYTAAHTPRDALPLGWEALEVSDAPVKWDAAYAELLELLRLIVRNEIVVSGVMCRHFAAASRTDAF
jgi:hypothetical protein